MHERVALLLEAPHAGLEDLSDFTQPTERGGGERREEVARAAATAGSLVNLFIDLR